ncbi:hypothetical protein BOX15_Mlig020149g1, partial [Macrostomum lignano]
APASSSNEAAAKEDNNEREEEGSDSEIFFDCPGDDSASPQLPESARRHAASSVPDGSPDMSSSAFCDPAGEPQPLRPPSMPAFRLHAATMPSSMNRESTPPPLPQAVPCDTLTAAAAAAAAMQDDFDSGRRLPDPRTVTLPPSVPAAPTPPDELPSSLPPPTQPPQQPPRFPLDAPMIERAATLSARQLDDPCGVEADPDGGNGAPVAVSTSGPSSFAAPPAAAGGASAPATAAATSATSAASADNSDGGSSAGLRSTGPFASIGRVLAHALDQAAGFRRRLRKQDGRPGHVGHQVAESDEELDYCLDLSKGMKFRAARAKKGDKDFINIKLVQEIRHEHCATVWCLRFSPCGVFLATGCNDNAVRMFVLRTHYRRYDAARQRISARFEAASSGSSTIVRLMSRTEAAISNDDDDFLDSVSSASGAAESEGWSSVADDELENSRKSPFRSKPFLVCRGHEAPVLDLSWSRNLFLLSASMDCTVRLWHVHKQDCLCSFSHSDYVPAIAFHPKDDRVFVSGSMDGKLRLWSLSDKKVSAWRQVPTRHTNMITALCFCRGGQLLAVGTYDGRVMFYDTAEKLSYHTLIDLYKESTVKRRKRNRGFFKVTGIETMPGDANRILVSSNDSRQRLIDLKDYQVVCKYKGATNKSHINAHFSPTGRYVISGSEDSCFYLWRTEHGFKRQSRFSVVRSDRNAFWEAIRASPAVVTCAVFSPQPLLVLDKRNTRSYEQADPESVRVPAPSGGSLPRDAKGEIIVTADFDGCLRVFKNKA